MSQETARAGQLRELGAVVHGEVLKATHAKSTLTVFGLAGALAFVLAGVEAAHAGPRDAVVQLQLASVSDMLSGGLAVLLMTAESTTSSWTCTLSLIPRRRSVLLGKWVVVGIAAAALAVVAGIGAVLGALLVPGWIYGLPSAGAWSLVEGSGFLPGLMIAAVAMSLLWASVAALWDNRVGALALWAVWEIGIFNVIGMEVPAVAKWLPEGIIQSFAHPTFVVDLVFGVAHGGIVSPGIAGAYLAAACLGVLTLATTVFLRRDVS